MFWKKISLFFYLSLFNITPTTQAEKTDKKKSVSLESQYGHHFINIYQKIKRNYVDAIDHEEILLDGLRGLTKKLDPYSKPLVGTKKNYYEQLSKGTYGGVGMHLSKIKETLTILAVFPETPASKNGLQSGDQIIEIENKKTKTFSLGECSNLLKGEQGTTVSLKIRRPHENKVYPIKLKRERISFQDLSRTELIDKKNLYIQLKKFSKNVAKDFSNALKKTDLSSLNSIILDLRGNTGGLLSSSLDLLDEILKKDQVILHLKGKGKSKKQTKKTRSKNHIPDHIKIMVLIDEASASASEIVAGALQDLDRAVIIGKTSYGKGLVQKIYKVTDHINLKLTTARYLTPSGRLIQKKNYGEAKPQDPNAIFKTKSGRIVSQNGGITPDVISKREKAPTFIYQLDKQNLFLLFASSYKKLYDLTFPIKISSEILKSFEAFIENYELKYTLPGEKSLAHLSSSLADLKNLYADKNNTEIQKKVKDIETYYTNLRKNPLNQKEIKKWVIRRLKEKFSYTLKGKHEELKQNLKYDNTFLKAIQLANDEKTYKALLEPKPEILNKKTEKDSK